MCISWAGLCVFLTNWEGRLPVHTVKTLLFLLLLSAISYSSSCSKIIRFSHCNFLKVDLMGVWNHRILTTKLLWLYESGSDVCFCEIIGTLKTGHFENPNSPTFCSSALSLIWSRVRKFSSEDVSGVFAFEVKFRLQTGSITSRSNSNYYCNAPWFWEHTLT